MSKFYANKFLILFSLIFFSSVYPEGQQIVLPEGSQTAIIQRIQELCAQTLPEDQAIAHNFKLEPFFKEFKETIKKITKKIIKENPELYTTLLSDMEKSFNVSEGPSFRQRALVIFDSTTLIRWLTTCMKDALFLLWIVPFFLPKDEFPADQRNEILKSDFCTIITSSAIQSAITEFLVCLEAKYPGYYYIETRQLFDYFITWIFALMIQTLNPRCRSEKILGGHFSASTIAHWLVFPFVCKRVIEQCRSCSSKNHVQEVKQSLQLLLEKYKELLEIEKSKEEVCAEQRALSSTQI